MKRKKSNRVLLNTNLFVCAIILLGFLATSIVSYRSNLGVFERDTEKVTALTAEGVYRQIESIFMKPMGVSLTMANDTLLQDLLRQEGARQNDEDYIAALTAYLNRYRKKYEYDSVFLVSALTGRYYHFDGIDRTLSPDNEEDTWYYSFLQSGEPHSLNVDNDQAAGNTITVFINCLISDSDGAPLGVVGVGFDVSTLQSLLGGYEERFSLRTCLVDSEGIIQVATDHTGYEETDLFAAGPYAGLREKLLAGREDATAFWHDGEEGRVYLGSHYIPSLSWYLLVENDTSAQTQQLRSRIIEGALIVLLVVLGVTLAISYIIHTYNRRIIELTRSTEQARRSIFQEATEQLFENIYELDITHNRAANLETQRYFESLGVPPGTPYNEALKIVAEKQIREDFRQGYIDTFAPEHVIDTYHRGEESLQYDFMISTDGAHYYWMRIVAQIVLWKEDQSIHMFTYRQNIDTIKRQEKQVLDQIQRDPMTGLLNKTATQSQIQQLLESGGQQLHAFFIVDIDNFKQVNDRFGHAAGDRVILHFAQSLKGAFREGDVVGRIGGDEFAVFFALSDRAVAEQKAREILATLNRPMNLDEGVCPLSASVGIALAPADGRDFDSLYRHADTALYTVKQQNKGSFALYGDGEAQK
ncbi:diguanylate cyclase domain-containing protein [Bittarella massiliensis (ex Durand et al. 2017)]|uniref:diguanylate cyclase domain-containing protein n=1 Tax=Bittarella massiliensis (ex Durand et al. 2017) TaxID=1720313 RepID=UPI0034A09770